LTQPGYDPQAPEGEVPGGYAYISWREIRWIALILVVVGIVLWPIWLVLAERGRRTVCSRNIHQIYKGISLYAVENDNRYPLVYAEDPHTGAPVLGANGLPISWAGDVFLYMRDAAPRTAEEEREFVSSFQCPTARPEEVAATLHPTRQGQALPLTYGMYRPYGGYAVNLIPNPDVAILLAETANFGARGTFNPAPLLDAEGNPIRNDAFLIGWNDGNEVPSEATRAVTRLAFFDTAEGNFLESGRSRHDGGVWAMTAGGTRLSLLPHMARTEGQLDGGLWDVPPVLRMGP
jgi:hypothetical protein